MSDGGLRVNTILQASLLLLSSRIIQFGEGQDIMEWVLEVEVLGTLQTFQQTTPPNLSS
jgi:hypothetical protein